ncbi:hypothetical protein RT717_26375 [Imperialibacter roseus]|uniref:Uncharacterized protein n=1 Tax=Imperialibacter roseus TaxID=1324217 RepID=A0ABZ0ISB4_9BACT|nr:hypothetical protein [Imperialibacter roseus]WOK06606.1 hypothetical protein RT717_26375 [Imperialibacter roseus]
MKYFVKYAKRFEPITGLLSVTTWFLDRILNLFNMENITIGVGTIQSICFLLIGLSVLVYLFRLRNKVDQLDVATKVQQLIIDYRSRKLVEIEEKETEKERVIITNEERSFFKSRIELMYPDFTANEIKKLLDVHLSNGHG